MKNQGLLAVIKTWQLWLYIYQSSFIKNNEILFPKSKKSLSGLHQKILSLMYFSHASYNLLWSVIPVKSERFYALFNKTIFPCLA